MALIIDFILLAASGAAAFYCIVLSRKLEALKNTEHGLGSAISTMSHSIEQARSTIVLAKESSAESARDLSPLIEETRELLPQLNELINVVSELSDIAVTEVKSAVDEANSLLDDRLEKAGKLQALMDQQLDTLSVLLDEPGDVGPDNKHGAECTIAYLDELETSEEKNQQKLTAQIRQRAAVGA